MNNLKNNYKEMKIQILKEAGFAQHSYWTTKLEQDKKFPNTKVTIRESRETSEGKSKWKQAELDVKTDEYKKMSKIATESLNIFQDCKKRYEQLSQNLVNAGILKRGLRADFYGEIINTLDKQKASELFNAKWEVNK